MRTKLGRNRLIVGLGLKNILLNWRHSAATIVSITLGFAAIALFDGFVAGLNEYIEESYVNKGMVGHVILEKEGAADHLYEDPWKYSITSAEQGAITSYLQQDPRVKAFLRSLTISGLLSNGTTNALFLGSGLEIENGVKIRGEKWAWNVVGGKPLQLAGSESFLLGTGLAQRMGCTYNSSGPLTQKDGSYVPDERSFRCASPQFQFSGTTESAQVNAVYGEPVAIQDFQLREFNSKVVAMPLGLAQRLMDTDRITRVQILLRDRRDIPDFIRDARRWAKEAGLSLEALKWLDHPLAASSKGGLEILRVFRMLFLSIVMIVSAMSVSTTMMKSVNERIRETGSLRSFGFRRNDILLLFSSEGLFLGLFSCASGIIISQLIAFGIEAAGLSFNSGIVSTPIPIHFALAGPAWTQCSILLCLVTFLSAAIVSYRASRMPVAEALRHVA